MLGPRRDRWDTKDVPAHGETQDTTIVLVDFFLSDAPHFKSRDGDITCDIQWFAERGAKGASRLDVFAKSLLTLVRPRISKCALELICAAHGHSVHG